ncbi:TPA: hypothetical protein DCZ39_04240 [Patescibacteria group bacterium]|nr:hypothetical protein [Candidatus Gracilibacteria bacterium]
MSHKTLFGLHRKIQIHNIYEYFENPKHTGLEVLNEEELKKLNLKNDNQKEENERKMTEREELDKKGRFGNFNNERFIFALGKEFNGGQQMAAAMGVGYFKIFES